MQTCMRHRRESRTSFRVKCFQHGVTRARSPSDPPRPKQVALLTLLSSECSTKLFDYF